MLGQASPARALRALVAGFEAHPGKRGLARGGSEIGVHFEHILDDSESEHTIVGTRLRNKKWLSQNGDRNHVELMEYSIIEMLESGWNQASVFRQCWNIPALIPAFSAA